MRIAMLGPLPGDREASLADGVFAGGVDAVVAALVDGLATIPGLDLHVVTAVPGLQAPIITHHPSTRDASRSAIGPPPSYTLHRVPHPRGDRLLWRQPVVRPLCRVLAEIKPDVVHAHMAGPYAGAALSSGRPAVTTLHGVVFREAALALAHSSLAARMRWQLDALYERWIVRRARYLIAISPYVAQEYQPLTHAQFDEIENPVADRFFDIPEVTLRPSRFRKPRRSGYDGGVTLLCVARVIPRKDILTLLASFARVHAAAPFVRLEIAGQTDADPAYTATCREAVERWGISDNVRFLGGLGGDDLTACYGRADLVLLTSRQETAPVAIAEAMAAGRAVVATAVGGVPFMVATGQTGLLAQPGDVAGLADAILALVNDSARRQAFGSAGRAEAERRFRLAAVTQRTVALYDRMLNDRGASLADRR